MVGAGAAMIGSALAWLAGSRIGRWIAATGGAILAILAARAMWRREGRRDAERDALEDTYERIEKGRDAVRDGRDAGDPVERLRRNDGRW